MGGRDESGQQVASIVCTQLRTELERQKGLTPTARLGAREGVERRALQAAFDAKKHRLEPARFHRYGETAVGLATQLYTEICMAARTLGLEVSETSTSADTEAPPPPSLSRETAPARPPSNPWLSLDTPPPQAPSTGFYTPQQVIAAWQARTTAAEQRVQVLEYQFQMLTSQVQQLRKRAEEAEESAERNQRRADAAERLAIQQRRRIVDLAVNADNPARKVA